jgi:hypothetical protein
MPLQMNPAEFVLELMNVDFAIHQDRAQGRLKQMQKGWQISAQAKYVTTEIATMNRTTKGGVLGNGKQSRANFFVVVLALLHRSFIKSYRDIVVYGVRIAMYTGTPFLFLSLRPSYYVDQVTLEPLLTTNQVWQFSWAPYGYGSVPTKVTSSHSSTQSSSVPLS